MQYGPRVRYNTLTPVSQNDTYEKWNITTGTLIYASSGSLIISEDSTRMDDVVIENFFSRMKSGEIFNNPMKRERVRTIRSYSDGAITSPPVTPPAARYRWQGTRDWIGLQGVGYLPVTTSDLSVIEQSKAFVKTQAYANVDSSKIQLLATVGEIHETKEMLVKAAHALLRFERAVFYFCGKIEEAISLYKAGARGRSLLSLYKIIEGVWMQLRFGWRPFIYEVRNLYSALQKAEDFSTRQTFRASTFVSVRKEDEITTVSGNEKYFFRRRYIYDVQMRAGVLSEQRLHGFPDTFGLTKIPGAIWELTKLSWAIDYFFNVGSFIAAWTPDTLWNPRAAWLVLRSSLRQKIEFLGYQQTNYSSTYRDGFHEKTTEIVERIPFSDRGSLTLHPRMNWMKYIDIVAVSRQKMTGTLKRFAKLYTTYLNQRKKKNAK